MNGILRVAAMTALLGLALPALAQPRQAPAQPAASPAAPGAPASPPPAPAPSPDPSHIADPPPPPPPPPSATGPGGTTGAATSTGTAPTPGAGTNTAPPATPPAPAARIAAPPAERPFGFEPPPAPAIVVIPLGDTRSEAAQQARTAAIASLGTISRGRPVTELTDPALLSAAAACRDAACYGGIVAQAHGAAGALLRITRRGARFELRLEIVDPVSGTPRGEATTATLTPGAEGAIGAQVTPVIAQLGGLMPTPPPPPTTLLVTTNVEGATVRIDRFEAGHAPMAPVTIRPGRYAVLVTAPTYHMVRQVIEISDGEQARLDVNLERDQVAVQIAQDQQEEREGGRPITKQWWFWAGAGAAAVAVTVLVVVLATGGDTPNPNGIRLPGIQ